MPQDQTSRVNVETLTTEMVLKAETAELWGVEEAAQIWDAPGDAEAKIRRYGRRMLEKNQAALCLSGGGIRSAAFALGVVQALSKKGLLPHFQYLSTVSGGGYLAGFLSRWIAEETERLTAEAKVAPPSGQDLPAKRQPPAAYRALVNVQNALAGGGETSTVEPAPIRWLRGNSNFITPRIGVASADTWTAIAMSVRNVWINWLVFAPALLLAVAFPYLGAALLAASGGLFADACLALGVVLIAFAAWLGARMLPSHVGIEERWDGGRIFRFITLPAALGAAAVSGGIAPLLPELKIWAGSPPSSGFVTGEWFSFVTWDRRAQISILTFLLIFAPLVAGYLGAWITAARARRPDLGHSNHRVFLRNLPVWLGGAALSAAFYVWGTSLILDVNCTFNSQGVVQGPCAWRRDVLATLAVVWGIFSQLMLTVAFVAFRRLPHKGHFLADLDREWLARLSAEKIRLSLAWTLFSAGALLFRHVVIGLFSYVTTSPEDALEWVTWLAGLVSGAIAVFGGKAAKTGYRPDPGSARKLLSFDVVVGIATFIFILILLFLVGQIEFKIVDWLSQSLPVTGRWSQVFGHIAAMIVIGVVLWLTSKRINVNRFSLNGMYRNRLARAFLGAGRHTRWDADPFTGFAPSDNIRLHTLKAADAEGRRVLLPVVNVALNLVGGTRLAWQERKAQAFIFTPIASGSAALAENPQTGEFEGRYVRSAIYAGGEPDLGLPGEGVSLATAIAISGAAASPSMGYHSSPATAFLMTLFNVRLGAWLPNPGRDDLPERLMKSSGPKNALIPLLRELLGLTDARGAAVFLSDGGHFENLGLYEMVRRRCRYIIVSDAGCDPGATFEDLGNAIRKIRIDLGVNIDIDTVKIVSREKLQDKSSFYAVGTIRYPEGDGELLYIKPACLEEIPADVRAYSLTSKDFPHESTADQWFSESQFESYRSLGMNLGDRLGAGKMYAAGGPPDFFATLRKSNAESNKHDS